MARQQVQAAFSQAMSSQSMATICSSLRLQTPPHSLFLPSQKKMEELPVKMFMTLFVVLRYVWPVSSSNEASRGSASSGLHTHMCKGNGEGGKVRGQTLHQRLQMTQAKQGLTFNKAVYIMCSVGGAPKGTKEPPCS